MIYIQMPFKHFRSNNLVVVDFPTEEWSNRRSNDNKYVLAHFLSFFFCFCFEIRVLAPIIDYYHRRALVLMISSRDFSSFYQGVCSWFHSSIVFFVLSQFFLAKNYSNILKNYFAIVRSFIGWDVVAFVIRSSCNPSYYYHLGCFACKSSTILVFLFRQVFEIENKLFGFYLSFVGCTMNAFTKWTASRLMKNRRERQKTKTKRQQQ